MADILAMVWMIDGVKVKNMASADRIFLFYAQIVEVNEV
jgi:hypothetical protein